MFDESSTSFQVMFIALVASVFIFMMVRIRKMWPERTQYWGLGIAVWLGLLIAYAQTSFIHNYTMRPPPILFVILPPLLLIIFIGTNKKINKHLSTLTTFIPVLIQGFRIVVELILWGLYKDGFLPKQMTFEGLNFDVIIGISAIPVAYLMMYNKINRKIVIIWNIIGILFLSSIVVIAFLSAPSPFRVFMNEPANTLITHFPFIWLPGFIVPFAYLMHVISIRQMLNNVSN